MGEVSHTIDLLGRVDCGRREFEGDRDLAGGSLHGYHLPLKRNDFVKLIGKQQLDVGKSFF